VVGGAQHWQTVCRNGKVSASNHDSLRKIIQYIVLLGINMSHNGIFLLSFSDRVDRRNEILFVCVSGGCGGGCGRVDEVPRVRLEKGAGLSTKGSHAHLDSRGWTGLRAGRRRCSHSFGEWRVWWWMWAGGRGPSRSFAEWRYVGRSTKDPRAYLRSGGWQWGVWGRPKPSHSLEGAVSGQ